MSGVPRIVLASASPRRRELLALLGLTYEVIPSRYEELLPDRFPDPADLAVHLATEKARDVAREHPDALVLGADTVVALGDRIYGKPVDAAEAVRMLQELAGRTHDVITGVALIHPGHPEPIVFPTRTEVTFRPLSREEMEAYAATGEPFDKAGGYGIQGYGALLITGIRGDYPNVVGLPLAPLAVQLRTLGIPVLGVPERASDGVSK